MKICLPGESALPGLCQVALLSISKSLWVLSEEVRLENSMKNRHINILWDGSHIWGLMAWRAVRSLGVSCRLVKAKEIAHQGALGKPQGILLVPGGGARLKARALGRRGREAIRQWLADGGYYMGFCGGAGLALAQRNDEDGLGVCPLRRASYSQRSFHLLSGHVMARTYSDELLPLPIWWPARFAGEISPGMVTLARYEFPAEDLWLSDLPVAKLPETIRQRDFMDFDFPGGQPLAVLGKYGKGIYLLSYAHLETPASYPANSWWISLCRRYFLLHVEQAEVPDWDTAKNQARSGFFAESLFGVFERTLRLLTVGKELLLFFRRAGWLWGWQAGVPGIACNHLLSALSTLMSLTPGSRALSLWCNVEAEFLEMAARFFPAAEELLWRIKLARSRRGELWDKEIRGITMELFGHPMEEGGICHALLNVLDELVYLSQENAYSR